MTSCSHISPISHLDEDLPVSEGFAAAQDDAGHAALDLPALEGSPAAARELVGGANLIFGFLVHFDPGFGLVGEVEYFLGISVHFFDELVNG